MICAVIDIGSNTIRLSTYEYDGVNMKKLFHKKNTAGLASYIKDDVMSHAGIQRCCQALTDFKETIDLLPIEIIKVFATASLRNIKNSKEAINEITEQTGFEIHLLSEKQEAEYGYYGIRCMYEMTRGLAIDIGGGSTEITLYSEETIKYANSFPVGSLNMYKKHIQNILPSKKEKQAIRKQAKEIIDKDILKKIKKCGSVVAIGGSARSILKIANTLFEFPTENTTLTLKQLERLDELLSQKDGNTTALILQSCPDRIHTLIPGLIILTTILKETKENSVNVCPLGVREGYLFFTFSLLTHDS